MKTEIVNRLAALKFATIQNVWTVPNQEDKSLPYFNGMAVTSETAFFFQQGGQIGKGGSYDGLLSCLGLWPKTYTHEAPAEGDMIAFNQVGKTEKGFNVWKWQKVTHDEHKLICLILACSSPEVRPDDKFIRKALSEITDVSVSALGRIVILGQSDPGGVAAYFAEKQKKGKKIGYLSAAEYLSSKVDILKDYKVWGEFRYLVANDQELRDLVPTTIIPTETSFRDGFNSVAAALKDWRPGVAA